MGEVWVARNEATGADVAVKLCRGNAASEESALRFRHEARLGAMLSHRSVVRIFDLVEESDGTLLLVMEFLRGETLERYLKAHGPLPTKEAIAIALPVLSALAHAHDFGVVHRDVTPSNIFLAIDPDGRVIPKLVDFGIAKVPASGVQTLDGRVLGTPRYMAPEQIRAQGEIDGRSDLFSVGVILYEMLTGTCPFAASVASASLAAVLETVVDPDARVEPRVWIELERALAKRAYERHNGANEMADALRAASGDTEANLAELLRRSPPLREAAADEVSPIHPTRSVGGQSFGYTGAFLVRRGALTTWLAAISLAGAVLVACLALAASAAFRHAPSERSVPAAASVEKTTPTGPLPSSDLPPLLAPSASPTLSARSVATVPAPATSNPNRPPSVRRVKSVATTPGF
jgi:serine/threonine protein kinase